MSNHEMNESHEKSLPLVDRAVAAVHDDAPDADTVRRAADRVWQRLSAAAEAAPAVSAEDVGSITGCDDYQALIPAYLAGELAPARRLLLEDHSRECMVCRRALIAARSAGSADSIEPSPQRAARPVRTARRWLPLAAAAVLAIAVLSVGYLAWDGWLGGGPVATVAAVNGDLLAVDGDRAAMARLAGGATLTAGEPARTAKGSTAVLRLNDGSTVELDERTQVRVRERRSGTTVYVDRGSIIVEASKQVKPRHLYVVTDEARVAVTGTIFAVQHGVKGSRVSVVEGEVEVRQGSEETVLHPGQQVTTRASLATVPVADEIAWSRNVDHYLALLSELTSLRKEIARRVAPAELRYDTSLAALAPADTLIFVSVPNLTGTLADSYQVLQERLATSPVLAEWWQQHGAEHEQEIDQTIARLRDFGSYLGSEVVVALAPEDGKPDEPGAPVVLAHVERPDAFRAYLEQELARIAEENGSPVDGLVLVDDLSNLPAGDDQLLVWLGDGLLVASNRADRLRAAVTAAGSGSGGFADSELGQAVTAAYADGTQWLLAVDLAPILASEAASDAEFAATGFGDVQRLVVERRDEGEHAVLTADLSFGAERHGVASWLAAPAPMGSLDFVSADAHVAAAFVVKEPTKLLDDVMAMSHAGGDDDDFADIESELGLSLRDDLAAPLGGEVAFAVDGPFLPEPSWKVVLEVYDPATLQHTLETAVTEADRRIRAEGGAGLVLGSEEPGGRTWYHLGKAGAEPRVYWVYVDGYMVVAPSRALLERTLDQRAAGSTLPASSIFRDLLPQDGRADFSAVFFQHLGPLLSPLSGTLARLGGGELTAEQQQTLAQIAADAEPTLAYAYADADRITVAGTGPGGPLGLGMNALSGIGGLASLGEALQVAAAAEAPQVE